MNEPRLQIEAVLLINGETKARIEATSVESLAEQLYKLERLEKLFMEDGAL